MLTVIVLQNCCASFVVEFPTELQNLQKDCQNLTLGTWIHSTLCLNIVFFVQDYAEKNEGNSLVKYFM